MPRVDKSAVAVGRIIRKAREKADLTQEQVASHARMDRSYISDVERGRASVSLSKFLRICSAMGVPGAKLVTEIEEKMRGNVGQ